MKPIACISAINNQLNYIPMNYEIPDELWGLKSPTKGAVAARRRFTTIVESEKFLQECEKLGFDIPAIINQALISFRPKLRPDGNTWEGISSVVN